jgi:hypothetical protein
MSLLLDHSLLGCVEGAWKVPEAFGEVVLSWSTKIPNSVAVR